MTDSQLLQLVPPAAAVEAAVATRMVKPKTSREGVEEVPCKLSPKAPERSLRKHIAGVTEFPSSAVVTWEPAASRRRRRSAR